MAAPCQADVMGSEGGEKAGDDFRADDAAANEFECEYCCGEGCAEDGAEACGDAAKHEELGTVAGLWDEFFKSRGEARTHLNGGAFASSGTAEEVGAEGGEKDARSEAGGDLLSFWITGSLYDRLIRGVHGFAMVSIVEAGDDAEDRQKKYQPRLGETQSGDLIKAPQKECG